MFKAGGVVAAAEVGGEDVAAHLCLLVDWFGQGLRVGC